jgi:hypothetical protein
MLQQRKVLKRGEYIFRWGMEGIDRHRLGQACSLIMGIGKEENRDNIGQKKQKKWQLGK